MKNVFEGKRYTTIVHIRHVFDVRLGKNFEYPWEYSVYDNKNECDVQIAGFNPTCYEDIYSKAIELNKKEEQN